jgi:hypothetical protein
MLRFIDCLSQSSISQLEQHREISQLKPECTDAIVQLGNETEDIRVIKLVSEVLANATTSRAWIPDCKVTQSKSTQFTTNLFVLELMVKFLTIAEEGEKYIKLAGEDNKQLISEMRHALIQDIELAPDRALQENKKIQLTHEVIVEEELELHDSDDILSNVQKFRNLEKSSVI